MEIDSINSTYTPPPAPAQSEPVPVEEPPASGEQVETPNSTVNVDIIA